MATIFQPQFYILTFDSLKKTDGTVVHMSDRDQSTEENSFMYSLCVELCTSFICMLFTHGTHIGSLHWHCGRSVEDRKLYMKIMVSKLVKSNIHLQLSIAKRSFIHPKQLNRSLST